MKVYSYKLGGFTLVELLVVVAIIAILATVGVTVYGGVQTGARNAARRADLEAIIGVLEAYKTAAGYQTLADSNFAGGVVPTVDKKDRPYCLQTSNTAAITNNPSAWTGTSCPASWGAVSAATPSANTAYWRVCTSLESPDTALCKSNVQ